MSEIAVILPRAFDFLAAVVVEGLEAHDVMFAASTESNGVTCGDPAQAEQLVAQGAVTILCTGYDVNASLAKQALRNKRLIVVDGSDHSDFLELDRLGINPADCMAVFKREYLKFWSKTSMPNVFPFPMAIGSDCIQAPSEKSILLSMLCNTRTNPERGAIAAWLSGLNMGSKIVVGSTNECAYNAWRPKPNRIETPRYHNLLASSLASVNLPGAGYDCKRYWEIVGARTLLVTKTLDIVIPNDFVSNKEKFEFSSVNELRDIVHVLSKNPEKAVDMINMATERANQFHTCAKRVEPLLELAFSL